MTRRAGVASTDPRRRAAAGCQPWARCNTPTQPFRRCKGEPAAAELGANTDANHPCTNFFGNIFWQIYFFLMLTKEYIFVLRNFQILHKLKKEGDLTSSRYLHMLDQCQHLLSQTK